MCCEYFRLRGDILSQISFDELAASFRYQVVKTWLFRSGLPQSKAALLLSAEAHDSGYVKEPKKLSGSMLAAWGKSRSTPYWAAAAALSLLLKDGWIPSTYSEWAGTAYLLVREKDSDDLDDYFHLLPENVDKMLAAGWIWAAIMARKNFVYEKKSYTDAPG
ncbi:hypothetical protein EDY01_22040 [Salmonella enterica]|nr:hypothetical protein [Salmonella enterica]